MQANGSPEDTMHGIRRWTDNRTIIRLVYIAICWLTGGFILDTFIGAGLFAKIALLYWIVFLVLFAAIAVSTNLAIYFAIDWTNWDYRRALRTVMMGAAFGAVSGAVIGGIGGGFEAMVKLAIHFAIVGGLLGWIGADIRTEEKEPILETYLR